MKAATNPALLVDGGGTSVGPLPSWPRAAELLDRFAEHQTPTKISSAVQQTENLLSSQPGGKVVIWTSYSENVAALQDALREHNPVAMGGRNGSAQTDPGSLHKRSFGRFEDDPECEVMIASPLALGDGVDLHPFCRNAVYVDLTFDAVAYLQSIEAVHGDGAGSMAPTRIRVLQATNTIDELIATRLRVKLEAMSSTLADPSRVDARLVDVETYDGLPAGLELGDVVEVMDYLFKVEGG